MGLPAEALEEIFTVIEGGSQLGNPGEIIQFPFDNGQGAVNVVEKTYKGTNGTGFNYWVVAFETLVGEVATAVSGGAALLGTSVPAFAAALAPAMGLTVGYISYNLAPAFWDKLAKDLIDAGETINGKVVAFMDENGVLTYSRQAIDILLGNLMDAGVFDVNAQIPDNPGEGTVALTDYMTPFEMWKYSSGLWGVYITFEGDAYTRLMSVFAEYNDYVPYSLIYTFSQSSGFPAGWFPFMRLIKPHDTITFGRDYGNDSVAISIRAYYSSTLKTITIMDIEIGFGGATGRMPSYWYQGIYYIDDVPACVSGINATADVSKIQEGAKLPSTGSVVSDFPQWHLVEFPEIDPAPGGSTPQEILPRYPIEYPDNLPDTEAVQIPAQNPEPAIETDPEKVGETITDPENNPRNKEVTDEEQVVDPDPPATEDEEIPSDETETPTDPIEPDPPGPITPVIPVPPLPSSISSNKLFTVYNPTSSQLDSLGGYLWDADFIDQLKRIWQDPLDGVISLRQVYCTPNTGSEQSIVLGFLNTGVPAKVVINQFKTIDCGSVEIKELKRNATDYTPYTSMKLYLPFIGITEIDADEFMEGRIAVKYHVDVYTGTCLAEVRMIRAKDVPNGGIVYTFNGNCSQQIPLTSGDSRELIATLLSAAGVGIGVASGGALGIATAAGMAANTIRKEMLHVSHSGNLSANAGIMGGKKPYVIINRQNPYNANSYNRLYGYPCNKTVYLGNCSGYVRVKAGRLQSKATQAEKDEIMEFLLDGVIM